MRPDIIPELEALPEAERIKVRLAVTLGIFKDWRVWGAYLAQILGFVLLFAVFLRTSQHKLLLVLAYALPTMLAIKALQRRVLRERVLAHLAAAAQKPPAPDEAR